MRLLEGETTNRMEALSDGIFAIVLTLQVLQFEVPDVPADDLPSVLADQEALLFSYLLSSASSDSTGSFTTTCFARSCVTTAFSCT